MPGHKFTSGETVSGKLRLEYSKDEPIDVLRLSFSGNVHTLTKKIIETVVSTGPEGGAMQRSSVISSRETVPLFGFNKTFINDHWTLPSEVCEWPFEFVFPELTQPYRPDLFERPDKLSDRVGDLEFPEHPHPLPPSFSVKEGEYRAAVEYELVARLEFEGSGSPVEAYLTVAFGRSPDHAAIEPRVFPHVLEPQWQKHRCFRPRPHTLVQKIMHILTKRPDLRTPCVRFVPTLWIPDVVKMGQTISIVFGIEHIRERPVDPEELTLVIKALRVKLVYTTAWVGELETYSHDLAFTLFSNVRMDSVLPLDNDKSILVEGVLIPHKGLPCFSTYTVRRDSYLNIEAVIRCTKPLNAHKDNPFEISCKVPVELVGKPEEPATKRERSLRPASSVGSFASTVRFHPTTKSEAH